MIENNPLVSIILSIRNESASIGYVLSALLAQDYPANHIEILVVDGMSTDDTPEIVRHFANLHPEFRVQLLENPRRIVPIGLNLALRCAQGQVILRVDGHTLIAPDYVRQCVRALQRTQADNVGGKMNAVGRNAFGKAIALATSTPFGVGGARFHYSDREEWVDTVYMGAWSRSIFEKIGLFDEELVRDQDDEFNYRLREQGGRILLSPAIRSEYTPRNTPSALWQQYFQYGLWKVRVMQKHPRQMRLRQFAPPAFVLLLLISLFLLFVPFPSFIIHPSFFIPLVYLLTNLIASTIIVLQTHRPKTKFSNFQSLLPLVYATMHISYGLGFLTGLLAFAHRWGDKQGHTPFFAIKDA